MNPAEFAEMLAILQESESWDKETIDRTGIVFQMARDIYMKSKNPTVVAVEETKC
jgi:hypothetical protein